MTYRVDLMERATRDLIHIYLTINADDSNQARTSFNRLEQAVSSLDEHPAQGAPILEGGELRHLLYGRRRHRYRIIYAVDALRSVVTVLHVRRGAQEAIDPEDEGLL